MDQKYDVHTVAYIKKVGQAFDRGRVGVSPEYLDYLSPLTEIQVEQTELPTCINSSSF